MTIPVPAFEADLDAIVEDIATLVRCESPSADHEAVRRSAEVVRRMATPLLGAEPEVVDVDGVTHLRWTLGDRSHPNRVLLLGHHDTVWPLGTIERLPWSTDAGVLRGPGCFDMKAGLALIFRAVAALRADGSTPPVTVLVTGDEEVGSPRSRALIEDEARGAVAALVLEASADGGALKSARKGVSLYSVGVTGRAAHAGLEPERGVNAGVELAHQVLRLAGLGDPGRGTTVTPTVLSAGTTTNTVPAAARVAVDVRAWTVQEQTRVDDEVRASSGHLPGAVVEVSGGVNRPPMEAATSAPLVALARRLHHELGLGDLGDTAVGGASDGNFSAGVGTPTLDGLGAVGGGAHAEDEHVLIDALPGRAALLAALVAELTR